MEEREWGERGMIEEEGQIQCACAVPTGGNYGNCVFERGYKCANRL